MILIPFRTMPRFLFGLISMAFGVVALLVSAAVFLSLN